MTDQAAPVVDLSQLAARAAEVDAGGAAPSGSIDAAGDAAGAGAPQSMDPVQSLAGLFAMVQNVKHVGYQRVAGVWSDDACLTLAAKTVPVLRKYPWGAPIIRFLSEGEAPEWLLLAAVIPIAFGTRAALKLDAADIEAANKQAESEQKDKPEALAGAT